MAGRPRVYIGYDPLPPEFYDSNIWPEGWIYAEDGSALDVEYHIFEFHSNDAQLWWDNYQEFPNNPHPLQVVWRAHDEVSNRTLIFTVRSQGILDYMEENAIADDPTSLNGSSKALTDIVRNIFRGALYYVFVNDQAHGNIKIASIRVAYGRIKFARMRGGQNKMKDIEDLAALVEAIFNEIGMTIPPKLQHLIRSLRRNVLIFRGDPQAQHKARNDQQYSRQHAPTIFQTSTTL